jgi:hypothetical protein
MRIFMPEFYPGAGRNEPRRAQRGLRPPPNNKELLNAKGAKNAKTKKRTIFKRGAGVPPAFFA